MHSYAAFLGHQPHLSVAELSAAIPDFCLKKVINKQIALFECSEQLDNDFLATLGSIVFLARRLTEDSVDLADVPQMLVNEVKGGRGKMVFSYRCSGLPSRTVKLLHRRTKDLLKKAGRTARYVGSERKGAFPIQLYEHDMLSGKKGCELMVVKTEQDLWVGRTVAAQDIESYAKRDMEKPFRDTATGLLPPKLAQVLLNFGLFLVRDMRQETLDTKETPKRKKKITLSVLDPFCGTGVIPLECLVRGWTVVASDVSQKAVNGCSTNIDWLRKEEKILKKDVASAVGKHDATKGFDLKEGIDVVVTETSLGSNLTKRMTATAAKKEQKENEKLQAAFLDNVAATLPGVPVVCIWPVWYPTKGGQVCLEGVWDAASKAGFEPVLPPDSEPWKEKRVSLLYRRPSQFVGREIVMLKPKAQSSS